MGKIEAIKEGDQLVIKLPQTISSEWAEQFVSESKSWLLMEVKTYTFDFSELTELKNQMYRPFVVLSQLCKKADRLTSSRNIRPAILSQIKSDGLESVFRPTVEVKVTASAGAGASLDVALINPFISATVNTLKMQAQTASKPGKPFLVKVDDKGYNPAIGIAGVISISTDRFKGSITLAFPESVFLKIYENMFGEKHDKINNEIEDAAGELINIVYGAAKTELNSKNGMDLKPVLPTILAGDKIRIRQRTNEKLVILPFEIEGGQFQIEIALEKS